MTTPAKLSDPSDPNPEMVTLSLFDTPEYDEVSSSLGGQDIATSEAPPVGSDDDFGIGPNDVARSPELPAEFPVRVVRSARRRKSIQARLIDGEIELRVPARATQNEIDAWAQEMQQRFDRSSATAEIDLTARSVALAGQLDLPSPESVRWVSNQAHRWGSCTINDRTIRLSDRLVRFPLWVIDYVLVHEMAHLVHADHSAEFWALVDRYPRADEAKGYLTAKSDGL